MLRTELDALPVEEKTGLPYASTVHTKDDAGHDVAVMHACGHDIHMAALGGDRNHHGTNQKASGMARCFWSRSRPRNASVGAEEHDCRRPVYALSQA